jgi:hypothetical protein
MVEIKINTESINVDGTEDRVFINDNIVAINIGLDTYTYSMKREWIYKNGFLLNGGDNS